MFQEFIMANILREQQYLMISFDSPYTDTYFKMEVLKNLISPNISGEFIQCKFDELVAFISKIGMYVNEISLI